MARIALFGASGAMGKSIAAALKNDNASYRVVGRSPTSLQKSFGDDSLAEIKTWNPDDPQSIREAAEGVETIIYLVGVNYWQFQLHPILMRRTIDGAIAAGVQRILLIGTVYSYGRPQSATVTEDHPRMPHTFKGKMRKEQEDLLFAAHQSGKIKACELRLPDFYGPNVDKSFLWSAFQAAKNGGRAQLVGPIDTPHQFVYVPDAGPIVARLLKTDGAWGLAWQFAGSGIITQRAFAEKIFAAAGRPSKFLVANKLMLRAFGLFNPLMREMVEMHYLQTSPILMDDSRLGQLLGGFRRTSYDEGIRETLEAMP
jgi:nucleoside-diphosphate-sugar epimerase